MEDIIGIILEHRGVVGVAIVAVALYLANRLDMLPTWKRTRVRIEWADVQAEREKEHAQRAADLKQAAKWAEIKEAQDRRLFTVIKGRSGGNEAPRRRLTRYERLEALADSGCDTWSEARGER